MAGRPPDVSDKKILRAVRLTFGPATAKEVAEEIGLKRSGTNKRLDDLVENEYLHDKQVGARAKVYWLSDKGEKNIQSASTESDD